jgi:integrase
MFYPRFEIGMLTDKAIRALHPRPKPYRVADGDSLFILVQPTGAKHWVYRYRFAGKETTLSYGLYGELPTAVARERHREARRAVKEGNNPTFQRQAAKARARLESANNFESVAREWLEGQRRKLASTTFEKAKRNFEALVFPWLGKLPINSIEPPDVLACLRRIEMGGHHETAHRQKQRISQVYRYAIAHGLAKSNPASDLSDALQPIVSKNRSAIIDPGEIGGLLRAIETFHGQFATACALRLSPLVFVRPGELRKAEWNEFDLDAGQWRIPGVKMKMREEHVVPLSIQAVAILRELYPLTGHHRYLFPGARSPSRPMSENTVNAALRRLGYDGETMTGHGFRALASTRLNEMGWAPDVIERQLAHAERNKVRAAYNRASYMTERVRMMQVWADYLDSLREGLSNVVAWRNNKSA